MVPPLWFVPVFFSPQRSSNMKRLLAGFAAIALELVIIGCQKETTGGGSGGDTKPAVTLHAPGTPTDVKQGDKQEVKVSIDRAKDSKDEVTLKFEAPKGI